jgi:hypothetical protein
MCYWQNMAAMHVRQSVRKRSSARALMTVVLLASASGACGEVVPEQPDAATAPPDAAGLADAAGPPDAAGPALVTLRHASSLTVQEVECLSCANDTMPETHADNSYFLVFDLAASGIAGDFEVVGVQVGILQSLAPNGRQPADVVLYTLPAGAELLRANLQFVATSAHEVPDTLRQVIELPIAAQIAAGSTLVVELFLPDGEADGNLFKMGCNRLGATGPSYVEAPTCAEIATITSFDDLMVGDKELVMAVVGRDLGGGDLRAR